jgi:uncharacterized protein YndB with AHSA1/START domain
VIEVTQQINSVRRTVGTRTLEAGEVRTVTVSQVYKAELADVWDACTSAERIPRWFLPVSGDLHAGGHYQLQGHAGGKIEHCDPPTGFTATWEYGGNVSWIELRLTAVDGGTRFELIHIAPDDDAKWAEFGPGAVGIGWDSVVMGLGLHLTAPEQALDPAAAMEWMASEEGRRFVTLASEAWYEANVAAGADPAQARAAADRSTAAYTATPEA